jgi:hypothetical protein
MAVECEVDGIEGKIAAYCCFTIEIRSSKSIKSEGKKGPTIFSGACVSMVIAHCGEPSMK